MPRVVSRRKPSVISISPPRRSRASAASRPRENSHPKSRRHAARSSPRTVRVESISVSSMASERVSRSSPTRRTPDRYASSNAGLEKRLPSSIEWAAQPSPRYSPRFQ